MSWIAIRTTGTRWEAEFMQQLLQAHQIPARVVNIGPSSYLGMGCPAQLQVQAADQWTALLLLSEVEEDAPE